MPQFLITLEAEGSQRTVVHEWDDEATAWNRESDIVDLANSLLPPEKQGRLVSVKPFSEEEYLKTIMSTN